MIKNKNIIIIGSIDWVTNWQTQHRLVTSLVNQNNKVLYIENTGIRSAKISDFSRIKDRLKNWFESTKGFKEVKNNLFIFSPIVFPFPFSKICNLINLFVVNFLLSNWFKTLKFNNDILISFLPTPLSYKIKQLVNANIDIYYCANEMKGVNNNKKIDEFENLFFKESDLTFVTSTNLKNKAKKVTKNVFFLPAGVELNKFDIKNVKKNIPIKGKPVIGYVGAITEVFDQNLVEFICTKNPNLNFVIIGRKYVNVKKLEKFKNIFFLNEIKHNKLPSYIKGFDLGIIPYKVNKFTHSVYSSKLNEYLSMGLPVVSTNIKESTVFNKNFNHVVYIGKNFKQFNEKIKESLMKNNKQKVNNRITVAKNNSWERRFNFFNELIKNKILSKNLDTVNWADKFIREYNKFFYTNIKKFVFVILFFLILFKSPLVPFFGDFLVVKDELKRTEMMVVFSGDGENEYHNLSFKKRIVDIRRIKKKYPDMKILLSGRAVIFRDADIIKSLLIYEGISQKDIFVIREDPYNTFENIIVVNNFIKKRNINSIVFLTSPYHTFRSKLIWKKNFPEVEVVIPKMIDTPQNKLTWGLKYDKIKVIFYEFLAIIYNKIKGWI